MGVWEEMLTFAVICEDALALALKNIEVNFIFSARYCYL